MIMWIICTQEYPDPIIVQRQRNKLPVYPQLIHHAPEPISEFCSRSADRLPASFLSRYPR